MLCWFEFLFRRANIPPTDRWPRFLRRLIAAFIKFIAEIYGKYTQKRVRDPPAISGHIRARQNRAGRIQQISGPPTGDRKRRDGGGPQMSLSAVRRNPTPGFTAEALPFSRGRRVTGPSGEGKIPGKPKNGSRFQFTFSYQFDGHKYTTCASSPVVPGDRPTRICSPGAFVFFTRGPRVGCGPRIQIF